MFLDFGTHSLIVKYTKTANQEHKLQQVTQNTILVSSPFSGGCILYPLIVFNESRAGKMTTETEGRV